ncbi:hypothetical protein ACTWQB_15515 [Piscibacillus sp. B03]
MNVDREACFIDWEHAKVDREACFIDWEHMNVDREFVLSIGSG